MALDKAIAADDVMRGFLGRGGPAADRDILDCSGSLDDPAPSGPGQATDSALRKYGKHLPGCQLGWTIPNCPYCGDHLEVPRAPGYLNREQWDSVKAGDYFCSRCRGSRAENSAHRYFWEHELPKRPCSCGLDAALAGSAEGETRAPADPSCRCCRMGAHTGERGVGLLDVAICGNCSHPLLWPVIPSKAEAERAVVEASQRMTEPLECPEGSNYANCLWCDGAAPDGTPVQHDSNCPWLAVVALRAQAAPEEPKA